MESDGQTDGHTNGAPLAPLPPIRRFLKELPPAAERLQERFKTTYLKVTVQVSSMSIRYKIAAALVLVLCLAIASLGLVSFGQQKRVLERQMAQRAEALARQVASAGKTGLLTKNDLGAFSVIKEVQSAPDVLYAMVLDSKGRVFAHNILREKGKTLREPEDKAALESSEVLVQHLLYGNREPILDAAVPITARLGPKTLRVGTARVGLSQEALVAATRRQKLIYLAITAAFIVFGLGVSFALGKLLTQRIIVLAGGMKVVSQGDFSHLVEVPSRDEIGNLAETFNEMILKLREKLHMEKYLSQSTLQLIRRLRDTERLKLGGEHRHVTVLFSDIRGFTSMSEALSADAVVDLLNVYLNLQAEVVYQMGGTVNKFVGDEVMALFTDADAEARAARAAIEIQRQVQSLNAVRGASGRRSAHLGIGINNGDVVMGNMGSERQMEYTVIGDPINAAARLCAAAQPGQVIISLPVARAIGAHATFRLLGPLAVKGKKDPLQICELVDAQGALRRHMRRQVSLPAKFTLEGLEEEAYPTRVMNIGLGGCLIATPQPLGIGSRVAIHIEDPSLSALGAVPGVVRHLRKEGGRYAAGLAFDDLLDDPKRLLSEWVHRVETDAAASTQVLKLESTPAPAPEPAPNPLPEA